MTVKLLVLLAAVAVVISAVAAASVGAAGDPRGAELTRYLSTASWPVRASTLRVESLADLLAFVIPLADPDGPALRGIPGRCSNVEALDTDERGTLARVVGPVRLQPQHARLSRGYAKVRAACKQAVPLVRAWFTSGERFFRTQSPVDERASKRAEAAARTELRRLAPTLRSFVESVAAWRSEVLRYAATLGVQPPAWVRELR
jgi:hypothetical protein